MDDQSPETRALLPSEPRALLAEALLEIVTLSNKVSELHTSMQLLAEDIDIISRSINVLGESFTNVKQEIMQETALVAAEAFEKQLTKLQSIISEARNPPKRRFWLSRV